MRALRPVVCICSLLAGAAGCSTSSSPAVDVHAVLTDEVSNVALPTLQAFDERAEGLRVAAAALEEEPNDAMLAATQQGWRAARAAWRRADALRFGPVVDEELDGAIDWWPADADSIEQQIAATGDLDATSVEALGTSTKGMMALEYLLFDAASGDGAVLAALQDDDAGPRRRTFVAALADNLRDKANQLVVAWSPAGGNFAGELSEAGNGSAAYPTEQAALDELVNQLVFQAEDVADAKLGKPLGKKTGGQVAPEAEESSRSDNSIADITDTLRGIESVYEGRYGELDGLAIADIVRSRNAGADDRMREALASALSAVERIPPPLRTALLEHPAEVEAAWQAVKDLRRALATEVVSLLGVTLQFNGNDGD